jgi:hypothetical protein
MFVSMLLISRLKEQRLEGYDELRTMVKKYVKGGDALFLPSLNFLFLLGLIEYHPKTDAFEYLGPK